MPAKSATSRKWIAGARLVGQAAAVLTLATGVNLTLAATFPHYEPIYIYLIAVAAVAWLSSALLGVTTAVVAVVMYDWMFAPVRVVPSMSFIIPLMIAVATAIATRAIRAPLIQRASLPIPVSPPLLPPIERPAAVDPEVIRDERVPELEAQLARARSQADHEARLRSEATTSARERASQLEKQIGTLEERLADQGNRSIAAKRDFDALVKRVAEADARNVALHQGLEAAQRRADEEHALAARESKLREQLEVAGHESLQKAASDLSTKHEATLLESKQRLEVATKKLEAAQKELSEMRVRAEREGVQRAQSERAAAEKLEKSLADQTQKHETALAEAKKRVEATTRRLDAAQNELNELRGHAERAVAQGAGAEKLQKSLAELTQKHETVVAEAKKQSDAAAARGNVLQRELDRTLASLSEEHARADREAKLRGQLETAARETLHRTADVSASHQREAAAAREAARVAEERAGSLAREMEQLRAAAEGSKRRVAELQSEMEQLRSSTQEQQRQAEETLQQNLGAISEARNSFQRELASVQRAMEQERVRADEESKAAERVEAELAAVRQELETTLQHAAERDSALGHTVLEATSARAEIDAERQRSEQLQSERDAIAREADEKLDSARAQLEAERQRSAQLQSERDQMTREVEAKLRLMAAQQENVMGDALLDREAAKAEMRTLTQKVHDLQRALNEQWSRGGAEPISREKIDAEWSEKLQKLAARHESAMGDALHEREASQAEMRTLHQKVHDLQRALDEARSRVGGGESISREKIEAEWSEKLQKIVNHLTEDHESDMGEALVEKEAAKAEARTLTARVTTLQQRLEEEREKFRQATERWQQERSSLEVQMQTAEQKGRRPSFPPTVEQPTPPPPPPAAPASRAHVVLIVHSDAGVRAMAKHSLQQAGYTVLTAADGLEGLRTATQQKPDVVLAEAVMPKMNARELVQLLKSRRETADVKIVLVSGSADADRGTDFRADDVIRNASDVEELRTVLANVLSRRGVAS